MQSFWYVWLQLCSRVYVWKPRPTLSSLFFFTVISMESSLQIMLSVRRCGRFSSTPQMERRHRSVRQPISLWYAMHTGVLTVLFLVIFEYLMIFLRWVGLWGGKKWCSWPPGCCSQSRSNWSDWGSCWEGKWLMPFLPQVGLSVYVMFQICPSWDSDTTIYNFPRHGNPE